MNNKFNHIKVSLINDDIVRFEYCPNDNFSNQESLFVSNKTPSNSEVSFIKNERISFNYKEYNFSFVEEDPLNTLIVKRNNEVVYKYHEIKNSGELPIPNKTPYVFPLMDSPRLLIPFEGYVKDNSGFILQPEVKDLYLLLCDKDYLKLRSQFIQLTGKNEMPRLKSFGLFSSRYYKYSQKSAMDMIREYEKHKIPLDTFILDTDWRDMEKLQGCGYTVNKELFPNIQEFFHFAHNHNLQVMMNDHPLPLREDLHVLDSEELEYRQSNLTSFYNKGLDGWWYDRNWICKLNSVNKNIASESLGNYLFHDVTKQFHLGFVIDQDVYKRSFVMNNVNNIHNGQYKEILDSRSHRYSLQWSGDTFSDEQTLRNEIVSLNKCANNMIAHFSSDIGGHMGNPNKSQYIRWMEYGAFSPVMRPHCTCDVKKFREPWNYDKATLDICRNYINMRYRLLNCFYTASFKNVNTGLGVCSPLYMYYPEDKKAYKEETSYMLGNSILVSPISGAGKPHSLTKKNFAKGLRLTIYPNGEFKGPKCYNKTVNSFTDIEKFFKKVKSLNKKAKKFSFRYKGDLVFKKEYQLSLQHNTETRIFINKKQILNDFGCYYPWFNELIRCKKNKHYKLTVESVQGRKLKLLDLIYYSILKNNKTKIYLPEGEWFNVFHRNVYQGKRYIKEKFKLDEMPIFVKAGSLLAMYKTVDNISKMSLKNIIYDYYTSKKEDVNDFFYEDDGITTGYLVGEYRKNEYRTHFEDNKYIVELKRSEKLLDDDVRFRNVIFKAHIRDNETIENILINGEPVRFKRHDHNKKALPFLDNEFARDSKTLAFKFKQNIQENYIIELIIRK